MHSTASDGSLPPADVVAAAARAGLAAIALTDHDSVAGMEEAHAAGERLDVRVIAGAELSAHDETGEVHLLALHLSRLSDVEEALAALRDARSVRAHRIV
jgi:predicted metal-dependent phosphoesterase TrpH